MWIFVVTGVYAGVLLPGLTVDVTLKGKRFESLAACENALHLVKTASPNLRIKSARCVRQ